MKSMLIMEVGRVLNSHGKGKPFGELTLTDLTIPYSTIASLDVFILTQSYDDTFRIMKIRRDVDNRVRTGMDQIERLVSHTESTLNEYYSNT